MADKGILQKISFGIYIKLLTHYIQSLKSVITYEIKNPVFGGAMNTVGANPSEAFANLECLLATYFTDAYYTKVLLQLLYPYF